MRITGQPVTDVVSLLETFFYKALQDDTINITFASDIIKIRWARTILNTDSESLYSV